MACEELKKEANKNIIEEKARIIYEEYISILSPKEVCTYWKVFPTVSFFNIREVMSEMMQVSISQSFFLLNPKSRRLGWSQN